MKFDRRIAQEPSFLSSDPTRLTKHKAHFEPIFSIFGTDFANSCQWLGPPDQGQVIYFGILKSSNVRSYCKGGGEDYAETKKSIQRCTICSLF